MSPADRLADGAPHRPRRTGSLRALVGLDRADVGDRRSPRARSSRRRVLVQRRVTLGALGLGVVIGAVLLAVSAPLGATVIALFVALLVVDLGLLVAHEQRRAEQAMSLAFRSQGARRAGAARRRTGS